MAVGPPSDAVGMPGILPDVLLLPSVVNAALLLVRRLCSFARGWSAARPSGVPSSLGSSSS